MKNYILFIAIISILNVFTSPGYALSLNGNGMTSVGYAKYYPQRNLYTNRYRQQQKNYIFSPQQAKYYGYRLPQTNGYTYNNPYYNPYRR